MVLNPTVVLDWVTGTLAVATVWLGSASWRSISVIKRLRQEEERNRREALFRACLVEQLENCRRLGQQGHGGVLERDNRLQAIVYSFDRFQHLLDGVALPVAVVRRLLAQRDLAEQDLAEAKWASTENKKAVLNSTSYETELPRSKALFSTQCVALLVRAEAEVEGLIDVVKEFAEQPWLTPDPQAQMLSSGHWESDFLAAGNPAWPTGNTAYEDCSPARRPLPTPPVQPAFPASTPTRTPQ